MTPDATIEAAPVEVRGAELVAAKPVMLFRSWDRWRLRTSA
jgi:hypothetical protein